MRWLGLQRFSPSPTGIVAQAANVSAIVASRTRERRASSDAGFIAT
jgi:hypothetical protein